MSTPTVLKNIRTQPQSLASVLAYQYENSALIKAAELIRSARRVIITGMGASLHASLLLEYSLSAQGIDATAIESGELVHYRTPALQHASVVIAVSRSGESAEVTKLLSAVKGRIPIVGITNTQGSTLDRESDCSLFVNSQLDELIAIQTYTGTVLTLHVLAAAVSGRFEEAHAEAKHAIQDLDQMIDRCEAQPWDTFLRPAVPVYFLGRGYAMASANEGALLLHETAKASAVAMTCAAFRHGPAEMVDEGFCGILFAPAGPTHDLNIMLAKDLKRFGGRVRVIGPNPVPDLDFCLTPAVSDSLAPVFDAIPLQFAALQLAQMRSVPIGQFRYTPMVTTDETSFTI